MSDENSVVVNERGDLAFVGRREEPSHLLRELRRARDECLAVIGLPKTEWRYPGISKLDFSLASYAPLYICPAVSLQHGTSGTLLLNEAEFCYSEPKRDVVETYGPYDGVLDLREIESINLRWIREMSFKKKFLSGYELSLGAADPLGAAGKDGTSGCYLVGKHTKTDLEPILFT